MSSSWRITRPLRVVTRLARGDKAVMSRLLAIPTARTAANPGGAMARMLGSEDPRLPAELVAERLPNLRALACFAEPAAPARLTMLTDSISAGSLFGGVGTAILLSVMLAQRLGIPLRIVTREAEPIPGNFATVLQAHGLSHSQNVEFLHAPLTPGAPSLSMGEQDLLLTTSWWTTWSALRGFDPARIVYLLQEDERMFYPAGDEQLLCRDVLCDTRLRFVINTGALRDHLIAEGMEGVTANSIAFEPAFPSVSYRPGPRAERRFFFYARPENPRNLFLRGIEVLAAAIERGVLRPEDWVFYIVGKNIPRIKFPSGVRVVFVEILPWPEYAALIRSIDVGLSLMYTPHPSYPPLDLAASGAVVVTNSYGSKTSLNRYCKNILCVDPNVDSLVEAISEAVKLADDKPRRLANFENAGICRDWEAAFAPVLDRLAG
jgi:glycosyltransferase involved in cell wall biosynthesis